MGRGTTPGPPLMLSSPLRTALRARFQSPMSPRARPEPVKVELVKVSPATERAIREGVRAIQRGGNTRALTRSELDRLAETGEFPWRDEPPTSS